MPENRYVPERRCIACRHVFPQDALIRITDTAEGLLLRTDNSMEGRSCYICRNEICIKKAFEKNFFAKSLRRNVSKNEMSELKSMIEKIL